MKRILVLCRNYQAAREAMMEAAKGSGAAHVHHAAMIVTRSDGAESRSFRVIRDQEGLNKVKGLSFHEVEGLENAPEDLHADIKALIR